MRYIIKKQATPSNARIQVADCVSDGVQRAEYPRFQVPFLRAKGPRVQGLLADEQEPTDGVPPAGEPEAAEDAPVGNAVQHRDVPVATVQRG